MPSAQDAEGDWPNPVTVSKTCLARGDEPVDDDVRVSNRKEVRMVGSM